MKKSFRISAVVAALGLVAGVASAHDATLTGNANVSGAISNTVTATAMVNGVGSVNSGAGSFNSSAATAQIGGKDAVSYNGLFGSQLGSTGWKGSADVSAAGTTDTKTTGYAYSTQTGAGTGGATMTGWSDAGANASATAKLYGNTGNVTVGGALDTGHPTNVMHGPDITIVAGNNQAAAALGVAGGTFTAAGHVESANGYVKGQVGGAVVDTKSVTVYAATDAVYGNAAVTGLPSGMQNANITQLDAGSAGTVSGSGQFQTSTGALGAYTGATLAPFKN